MFYNLILPHSSNATRSVFNINISFSFFLQSSSREVLSRTENPSAAWNCRRTMRTSLDSSWSFSSALGSAGPSQMSWEACPHSRLNFVPIPFCYCVASTALSPAVLYSSRFPSPPPSPFSPPFFVSGLILCVEIGFVGWKWDVFISRWCFHDIYRDAEWQVTG